MDLGTGDGWMTDPDIKLFDSNKFAGEIKQLDTDEGTLITPEQYNDFISFLTQIANTHVDFGQKASLEGDQQMLLYAVGNAQAQVSTGELDTDSVAQCVQQLVQEGHCNNILEYLNVMHKDEIDFSSGGESQNLQDTLNEVCQYTGDVKGDQPILVSLAQGFLQSF
ncbi:uncharacterized protein A1O5_11150 [Cladophialophora psammophila CBS 110553]|uniref:Uncharacterized protein n=1 Tax=Cladophialophora psammophila CBS 110553 TaxID=1182543 RepID=W9WCD6_9EURO|nr:uncharacterized protein A1O5_11150 [Cladophialophora psammophila CBS 110553]EXJ65623.1 hypothetical protein A1O5_11150 [Cladophialophora psammophila CBS 110553]